MAVPKFYCFLASFLRGLEDGEIHTSKDMQKYVAVDMKLTDDDLSEMLPSGTQSTYSNRVHWARTYLNKAGLIQTPNRGHYQITEEGKKALASGETIDLQFLERYPSYKEFHATSPSMGKVEIAENSISDENTSPMEQLDAAYSMITSTLASELMDEVMKLSPTEFEHLVVQLLLKIGYGSGIDDAAIVTKATGDGGIDGIIKEDQLGFSSIYIQAKQWAPDRKVDRPEVQKFTGALYGGKASKGLFITTASFTGGAKEYVEGLHGITIVLIDGAQLMRLMIKHNIGVSTEHIYEIKRIDSDFFADSL